MSQFMVTAAQLRAKAEELSAQNTQLKSQTDNLAQTEASLNGMWEGDAQNAFHGLFTQNKAKMDTFYNAIIQYVNVLNSAADTYAQAEAQNVEIAGSQG